MKIGIVMPAYNEEKRIGRTLEAYCSFFSQKKRKEGLDFEILVAINNTKDKTENIVKSFQKKCKELKCLNFKQGGKGFAVKKGFEYALKRNFDFIGFTDADDSTNAENFYKILKFVKNCDGTMGSRYVKGSIVRPKQLLSRIIASRVFNFITRSLFLMPFRDTQNGGKIFKREVIKKIISHLSITQWAFDIDLLYNVKKQGFNIKEIPICWKDSEGSKINIIRSSIQMLLAILQLRLANSKLKRFSLILKPIVKLVYEAIK